MKLSNTQLPRLTKNPSDKEITEFLYQAFVYHNVGGSIRNLSGTDVLMCTGFKNAISIEPVDSQHNIHSHWFYPDIGKPESKIQVSVIKKDNSPDTFVLERLESGDSQVPEEITLFRIEQSLDCMYNHQNPTVQAKAKGWARLSGACVQEFRNNKQLSEDVVAQLYNKHYVADDMNLPSTAQQFNKLPERNRQSWQCAIEDLQKQFNCCQADSASTSVSLFAAGGDTNESAASNDGIATTPAVRPSC